jgi:hypothetical protein
MTFVLPDKVKSLGRQEKNQTSIDGKPTNIMSKNA